MITNILVIFLFPLYITPSVFGDKDVIFAAIVFRHGDRTPVHPYPNDPYKNESLWPVKFGELTNIGKLQHYHLGQWFRKRYSHLLSLDFNPSEIYVRSTDVDRTLMSVQANLAGMYPPSSRSLWDSDLKWQPIPVHTIPSSMDNLLHMKKPCPEYKAEEARVKKSEEYKKKFNSYRKLIDYVSLHAGVKIESFDAMEYVYSTLKIEKNNNFTLPQWAEDVFESMKGPACYSFVLEAYNTAMARLIAGPLVKDITKHMKKAAAAYETGEAASKTMPLAEIIGESDTVKEPSPEQAFKVVMFSGHDETVANLLNALGLFDGECPAFTATVLLELLDVNGEVSVRVSLRNTVDIVEPSVLEIKGCGQICPLSKFIAIYEPLMPQDWDKECQLRGFLCGTKSGWCWFNCLVIFVLISCWAFLLFKTPYKDLCNWTFNRQRYSEISNSYRPNSLSEIQFGKA